MADETAESVPAYETILVERRDDGVAVLTINRPDALNALSSQVLADFTDALGELDRDDAVGAVVITGAGKAFAAGADIKEMSARDYQSMMRDDYFGGWSVLAEFRKPTIAAVNGFALGGGCELAMMCDLIIASEKAKFGQPEIKLGVLPGMGGTQRLIRAVGKAKAMDLCLTGRMMDATEAERAGLVARVVPPESVLSDALETAATIAGMSHPVTRLTKETINRAYDTTLSEGLRYERRLFHSLFATDDQTEGMAAFTEKRPPNWTHR